MGTLKPKGFTTRSIHAKANRQDPYGALAVPIYNNAAFEFDSAEDLEQAFLGRKVGHTYSRISNPTAEYLELKVRQVTGAKGVLAVSSGMAAISATLMAITKSGDKILTGSHLFGNTWSLLTRTLAQGGLETIFVDVTDAAKARQQLPVDTSRVRAIFVETISNPQMELNDLKGLSALAKELKVPLIADTTMTPPGLLDAQAAGIDVELISSTKYISGGATSVGGLIVDYGTFDWRHNPLLEEAAKSTGPWALLGRLRTRIYRDLGLCLSPHNAWLQALGLDTLALRAERSTRNALDLARHLQGKKAIQKVNHPSLPGNPWAERAAELYPQGTGGVLTVEFAGKDKAFAFMNRLQFIRRATNIHDNKSLVIHPASTIFCEYSPAQRLELGVPDTLVRFSAGIEDIADLVADIDQALEGVE